MDLNDFNQRIYNTIEELFDYCVNYDNKLIIQLRNLFNSFTVLSIFQQYSVQ